MSVDRSKLWAKVGVFSLSFLIIFSQSAVCWGTSDTSSGLNPTQKNLLLAKPAVIQITNIVTGELVLQASAAMELNTPQLAGRSYKFTLGATGSGFFVSPDGYLITNGHVANPEDDLIAYFAVSQLAPAIFKDAVRLVAEANLGYAIPADMEYVVEQAYNETLQTEYGGDIQKLADDLYKEFGSGRLKMSNVKKSNYIQTGHAFGSQTKVEQVGKPARLIDSPYQGEFNSNDLALLKVEGSNFPTVKIGEAQNMQIGKELYAIGYPSIVNKLMGILTTEESQLEPSITKGVVSAKKKLVDGTEAFQTDAAITHGNSGGPAVDSNGMVVGVVTWSFSDDPGGDGFNFLISSEEVKRILSKNNVNTDTSSLTNISWEKGLDLFSQKKYSLALKEFENVKRLYPDNIDVQNYITKSQEAISRGEDKSSYWGWIILGVVVVGGLILLVIVVVVIILLVRKGKSQGPGPGTGGTGKPRVGTKTQIRGSSGK